MALHGNGRHVEHAVVRGHVWLTVNIHFPDDAIRPTKPSFDMGTTQGQGMGREQPIAASSERDSHLSKLLFDVPAGRLLLRGEPRCSAAKPVLPVPAHCGHVVIVNARLAAAAVANVVARHTRAVPELALGGQPADATDVLRRTR